MTTKWSIFTPKSGRAIHERTWTWKNNESYWNFFFDKTVQCRWAAGYLVVISYFFFDLSACSCYTAFKALPSLHCYLRPSLALIQYKSRSDDDVKGFPFFFFFLKLGFFFERKTRRDKRHPKTAPQRRYWSTFEERSLACLLWQLFVVMESI